MSKKLNYGTINNEALSTISKYHVAYLEVKSLTETCRKEVKKIEAEIAEIKERRKNDLEQGLSEAEVLEKHPFDGRFEKINALEEQLRKDLEPHKKAKKEALSELIPADLYYGYILFCEKFSMDCKGSVEIKKGKKTEIHDINTSYKAMVKDFAEKIGLGNTDNDTAIGKFANMMIVRTGGVVKCSKGEDYTKFKSPSQYNELFMLVFLQFVIREKGVVTINDDGTLSMTVFENDAE